ncbi:hypothetical protein CI610_02721 [invertebrate metagenome]|uniref:Uncharacterized protein n=1 Tax=invertebrate metagenome TaxID=1711999 RepID=A0A2H9T550_9ZZZZ
MRWKGKFCSAGLLIYLTGKRCASCQVQFWLLSVSYKSCTFLNGRYCI